jgi:acetylglutamate kinase
VNVNADEAALGIARAVGATTLVYLSDVDGVRLGERTAERLTPEEAREKIEDGTIAGGMALKVRVALEASAAGIPEVVIAGKARLLGQFAGTKILVSGVREDRPSEGTSRNGQLPRNPHDRDSEGA